MLVKALSLSLYPFMIGEHVKIYSVQMLLDIVLYQGI